MEEYSGMGVTEQANESWFNMTTGSSGSNIQTENNTLQKALSYTLTVVIAIVMIGVGCGVDVRLLKIHFVRPIGIIVGFLCQFFLMPIIAFSLAKIAQMEDIETLGLLLVGSCPGGTFSNIATYWAGGDLGLSVAMTTMSNTLGLGMMPLLLYIYSYAFSSRLVVPFQTIGIALASLVIPIGIGMIIRFKKPELAKKIVKYLSAIGGVVILALVITALISYGSALQLTTTQIACAAVFPIIGMILGYGLSSLASLIPKFHLKHKERRTICFETGVQNTQLAGAIIQLSFGFQQIVRLILFPLAYFISQLIWVILLLIAYRIYVAKFQKKLDDNESTQDDDEEKGRNSSKGEENSAFESDPPPYTDIEAESQEQVSKL